MSGSEAVWPTDCSPRHSHLAHTTVATQTAGREDITGSQSSQSSLGLPPSQQTQSGEKEDKKLTIIVFIFRISKVR